jgi:hypothetical protein
MLAFLDESGDTGRKIESGSSRYFIVSLVLFLDDDEALACDRRIELLRTELSLPDSYEFHFSDNPKRVKDAFLNAVNPYNFSVLTVAINKDPSKLYGDGFDVKSSFYKYACQMVLTNALPYLDQATLILDKSGNATFQGALRNYLRKKLNDHERLKIKKMKAQPSHTNNLLQLVDYCVGVSNRKIQKKKDWEGYYKYLSTKIVSWQEWPK